MAKKKLASSSSSSSPSAAAAAGAETTTSSSSAATKKKKRKHHESPLTSQKEVELASSSVHNNADNNDQHSHTHNQRRHKQWKSKQALKEEAEERRLTALLFGGSTSSSAAAAATTEDTHFAEEEEEDNDETGKLGKTKLGKGDHHQEPSSSLFFEIDRTGAASADDDDDDNEEEYDDERKHQSSTSRRREHEKVANDRNDDDDDDEDSNHNDDDPTTTKPSAAWVDDDDDDVNVDLLGTDRLRKLRTSRDEDTKSRPLSGRELQERLRARYKATLQTTAQTAWAQFDDQDDDTQHDKTITNDIDNDDTTLALQSSSEPLLCHAHHPGSSSGRLPPNILNVMRCPDANQSDPNNAVVQAVHFHPGSDPDRPLLLTAGLDKTLRFFQVMGTETSKKIHGIHFPKLPIYSAAFLGDTGKVVVSGRRPFFYIYDSIGGTLDFVPRIAGREEKSFERCVPSPDGKLIAFMGNDGYIVLVDVHSKQWIANLKMNGSVRSITFTPDGEYILASGSDGDVYRWEVRSRRCVERFANQDGTTTSHLAASTRRQLAVGSESGVVNLYSDHFSRRQQQQAAGGGGMDMDRTPIKSIMNLQTSADMLRFNHDGQILAMSSRREKHAMKLVHVPTATVFSNWPTSKTPLQYVWSMDFSPQSKYLALGNDKGKCLLYQLGHYHSQQ